MAAIKVLIIKFANRISPHEVPLLRGAIISALEHKLLLFHNHEGDNYRYRYPLIQYRLIRGQAALVCINEGAEQVGEFFATGDFSVILGERPVTLQVERVIPRRYQMQVWQQTFNYRITRWLPLNQKNYALYCATESLTKRIEMLQRILTGNILSMATGLGIHFDNTAQCTITHLAEPYKVTVKGVKMMAFNATFTTNVSLPPNVGLGKHASLNCGTVTQVRRRDPDDCGPDAVAPAAGDYAPSLVTVSAPPLPDSQ